MTKNSWLYVLLFLFAFSCTEKNKNKNNIHQVKIVEAKGYVVPEDSMAEPKVILVDQSKLKKIPAGKLTVVGINTNIHPVGKPKINTVGKPRIYTPGQNPFKLPKTLLAKGSSFEAGIPQIVIAKDAYTKDQNPENFSSFSKLQGLTHTNINFLYEDNLGNLWLGTGGGGVSKYDGKTFTNFTEKEGLSNNIVTSIIQDKSGNLWFGTESGGVSKYDGKTFTNFTEKEGLANNYVTSILQDNLGNLWFGTGGGGVCKYDGRMFVQFTEKEGLSNNFVTSIIQDKAKNIWIGTKQGGVSKYDGKSFFNFTEKEGLSNNFVSSILQDQLGNIWFGTNGTGIIKYDGKSFINYTETEGLSNNFVTSIIQDKSGDIWFGTNGVGVSKFDYKNFTHFTEKEGLNNNIIRNILQDRNGTLWFAKGGGGVSKYNPKSFRHYTEKEGLSNSTVLSIIQDVSKKIWFGTEGGGVSIYDGNSYTYITKKDGLSDNIVYSILQDNSGNFWFGTSAGLTKYDGKYFTQFKNIEGLSNITVYSILQDKLGCIWIGTDGGGAFKFDGKSFKNYTKKQGLSSNSVRIIFEDSFKNIWFGTYGGGLSKYNGKSFTHFTEKQGMPDDFVRSIIEDKSGNLWLGGLGFNGLTKYDGKYFYSFTEKEGLSNNVVCSILQDKSGNIWIGTRFGLSKLSTENLAKINDLVNYKSTKESAKYFESFVYEDGFLGVGCNSNAIYNANEGTIWVGANDRLTVFTTSNFEDAADTIAPNMQLTSIELFNENIPWVNLKNKKDSILILGNGVAISNFEFDSISKWYSLPENLCLAYNNNYLTFNFIGITTMRPKKVKYQYKLEGIDENWSAITNKTEATYGNLPHGFYTFKVKAMNSEGFWSNESDYSFVILPPWWQTLWFKTLIVLLIVGSIWFYIKWRERKLKTEKEILEQIVAERTSEVVEEKKIVIEKNILVEAQKQLIEEKHKEITDSINYAERIQRALLASKKMLDENLSDYFILFKPKDVVSGDFYWATKLSNNNFVLVNADSTGHGVPGAIMSILNIACLDKAVTKGIISPDLILNETRGLIIENLKNDGSAEGGKDGMDGSLLSFDFKNNILHCASANNPVWVIRNVKSSGVENKHELIEIKADRLPIGKHDRDNIPFTLHTLNLQKGDVVYTLTDGFSDQFGGANGRKFKHKQLQNLLLTIAHEPMETQKQKLNNVFDNWKGNLEQVDDVTLIGVRV